MKKYLLAFSALCMASNAFAAIDCNSTPSCDSLGYTKSQSDCLGQEAIRCPFDISAYYCLDKCLLWDGKTYTKAIVDKFGQNALVAYAATKFYVGSKTGIFGQGNWYVPAIGEWAELCGYDLSQMTSAYGTSGVTGTNKNLIQETLKALKAANSSAVELPTSNSNCYWTSTARPDISTGMWRLCPSNGDRGKNTPTGDDRVRVFLQLDDFKSSFTGLNGLSSPQVGHVVYTDKTYGTAANYSSSKTPAGVITYVSKDGKQVKIINLKDLAFSSKKSAGNFDPDNPYSGATDDVAFLSSTNTNTDKDIANLGIVIKDSEVLRLLNADAAGTCVRP